MTCRECGREITEDEVSIESWFMDDHWFVCGQCDVFIEVAVVVGEGR